MLSHLHLIGGEPTYTIENFSNTGLIILIEEWIMYRVI